jgi:hypothetical protein
VKEVTSAALEPRPVLWASGRETSYLRKLEECEVGFPGFE